MGYTSTRLEVNVVCGAVPPTPATREPYPDLACGNGPRPIRGRFVHRGALLGDAVYPSLATRSVREVLVPQMYWFGFGLMVPLGLS